jgi:hypothetical protein
VATALGVPSLSGWSLIGNVVAKAAGPRRNDAQRNIAQMNLQLELAKDQKFRLDDMLEQIEVCAGEGQKRLEVFCRRIAEIQSLFDSTLTDLQDQFGTVVMRRRELGADLALNRRLVSERLGMIQQDVAALAAATDSLAQVGAAPKARALAVATRRDLRRQGLGDVEVQVKDPTDYAKAKPLTGTVERWLALPTKRS